MFYYPVALFILIVGTVNAVNLTDGIDGLAGSVTFIASLGFMVIAALLSVYEMQLLAVAVAGAMLGFLVWNFHPAKVFMGDTGSMFLGGLVVAMGFGLGLPFLIAMIGNYLSDRNSFGDVAGRFFQIDWQTDFKMSPIHHHFEMSGWGEVKIVSVFSLVTAAGCALAIWWVVSL